MATTEIALGNCIFCERPLQDDVVVHNMPVCKYCMQGHPQPGNTLGILVPPRVMWRRLKIILPGIIIGLVVGCSVSSLAFIRLTSSYVLLAIVGGVFGFLFCVLLWEFIFFSRLNHAGSDEWKSYLVETLNLENVVRRTQSKPSLVICSWKRLGLRDFTAPMQAGILLEIPQGMIFNSTQGTRAIIPYSGIGTVGVERLKIFPPRMALRLDLNSAVNTADGLPTLKEQMKPKHIFFAFMDEKSFKANSQKAKIQEQAIQKILVNS